MKRILCATLSVMCLLSFFCGCSKSEQAEEFEAPPEIGFMVAGQFDGYKLGTVSSLLSEEVIKNHLPSSDVLSYKNASEGLSALKNKKIHGMVLPVLYADNELQNIKGIGKIEQTFIDRQLCAVFLPSSDYVLPIDAALTLIKNNGKAKKIALSHSPYATDEDNYSRPADYQKVEGRVIKIGICSEDAYPYNYHNEKGVISGINVDVAHEIAAEVYAELEIKEYSEKDLITALENKEVDAIMSQYEYNEKGMLGEKLLLSQSYCDASFVILTKTEYLGNSKDILKELSAEQ